MTSHEYIKNALRTEPEKYLFEDTGSLDKRIEHAIMGLVTESGELMDVVKKTKLYNREVDKVNLVEEMGDVMWYLAVMADALGVTFEDAWQKNINKLRARFPEKFDLDQAINRDLDIERKILEV